MILIGEYFGETNNRQSYVYKTGDVYIVKMNKNWNNQYVSEFLNIDEAEDCAEDWING